MKKIDCSIHPRNQSLIHRCVCSLIGTLIVKSSYILVILCYTRETKDLNFRNRIYISFQLVRIKLEIVLLYLPR